MSSRSRREGKGPAFQLSTPFPSFLKIVVQQALQDGKLKIPKMVVMEYGDLMADKIFLEVPDGAVWPVKLTRPCNGEIWMQKGWPEFAKFYSLKHGCLLIFRYEGEHSHFRVRIFMRNTLELEYFSSSTDDEAEGNSNPSSETEGEGNKHDREKRTHGADHGGKSTASEAPLRTFAKTELEDLAYSKALSFKSNNPFFVMKMHLSYLSTHLPISVPFANKHICARKLGPIKNLFLRIEKQTLSSPTSFLSFFLSLCVLVIPSTQATARLAEMNMATTSSFSLTKIVGFPPPPSPSRSCSMILGVKEGQERWGGGNGMAVKARFGSSKGGAGVLERPKFDQSQFDPATQLEQGGDIGRLKDKRGIGSGDGYRVLLVDDVRHTEKLVAKVVPQVVPSVTPDDARGLFLKSRENGVAVVIVTVKEHAEFYSQMMIRGGLRSTIEPDSNSL